jgi:hypothetical protein
VNGIATDIELVLWMKLQRPELLELYADTCDDLAAANDEPGALEVAAGTARALLRGEDPLATFRRLAVCVPDLYDDDQGNVGQ